MKQKYLSALCAILLMCATSCGEDFLYKAPQGSIDQDALTTAQGVELLVTNTYANLTEPDWGASVFNWAYGGIYGGDAHKGSESGDQPILNEVEIYKVVSTNSYLEEKWKWVYKGVKRANLALQVMDAATDMDETLRNARRGEVLFLRSMFYLEGIKMFSEYIPYIDESITDNDPKVHNDKDIYPDVLEDITEAITLLPEKPDAVGRVNVWAAKMLKAKILMQQGNMTAAQPILKDVLDNGVTSFGKSYALADDMNDNWSTYKDNSSPESIWEIQFSADSEDNGNMGMSLCYPHGGGSAGQPGGCCGFYQPTYDLVNSFQVDENGLPYLNGEFRTKPSVTELGDSSKITTDKTIAVDPRLDFAVGRWDIPYKDFGVPQKSWVRDPSFGGIFLPKKHVFSNAEKEDGLGRSNMSAGWAPGSAMNIQYLSVRDAILLYAECLAEVGDLPAAMAQVNKIRERAGLEVNIIKDEDGQPAANYQVALYPAESHPAFTSKETCIKAIRMERKLELAMEGQRWFDLSRWGGEYMSKEIKAYTDYEGSRYFGRLLGAELPASKTMLPIPFNQVETMGKDESGNDYLQQSAAWK